MESTFAANPNVNILYVFDEQTAFVDKREADNHANRIGKKYEIVERKEKEVKPKKEK